MWKLAVAGAVPLQSWHSAQALVGIPLHAVATLFRFTMPATVFLLSPTSRPTRR
jgi:hypothetical protein